MRPAAAPILAAALIACSSQAAAQPPTSPTSPAQSAAADLRTHLDLLLGEHVMIVAKESAAAVNHSDEYAPYTSLLGANAADLSALVGRAYGSTTASQFRQAWDTRNGYLVDYAIGVVSHDDGKANTAIAALRNAQVLDGMALSAQADEDKAFIDDAMAQKYASFYADLHVAYAHAQSAGDSLAQQIVRRFPDRFPGDSSAPAVESRVTANLALQEHSYLLTMATDAAVAKRDAERVAATSALAAGAGKLGKAWSEWDAAVVVYAAASDFQRATFDDELGSATHAPKPAVQHLVNTTIKVVDDQKAKSSKTLADDDRAAATATQPLADALA